MAAAELTEALRHTTGLSHDKSKMGVAVILEYLMNHNMCLSHLSGVVQALAEVVCFICYST